MNRMAALESELRRAAANTRRRRRQRGHMGPPVANGTAPAGAGAAPAPPPTAAAPPPAATTAPPPPAPDLATPRPSGSLAASVAAAMDNWAGASTYPRRPYGRHGPARARARSMALTLDFRVPNLPMPMKQPTNMVCWATVATLMASWRDQQSYTLSGYIDGLGEPWKTKLATNQGLKASEAPQLLATMGMQVETTQANFTAERWEQMLHDFGPLWVTADNNSKPDIQGIHAHILVGIHGPSDGDPTVDIIDPGVGAEVQMPMSAFVARYEQLANTRYAGLQIRHWPPGAQRAAQQSLRWAQQASERMARASDGGAGAGVALAALGWEVFKEVVEGQRGLKWTRAEMKGIKCPRNDKKFENKGTYRLATLPSKMTVRYDDWGPDDYLGAEFEIRYRYNGNCVRDVQIQNTSTAPPAPLTGRNLEVFTDIVDASEYERGNVAAMEVTLIYSFSGATGSHGTYTERLVVFGDGRAAIRTGKWDK
jgi:Papain-like cysteine protease AvrRpt2